MDTATKTALDEALDDEYKARATYAKVLDAFGDARPFVNIVEAEGRHIEALLSLYERFGVAPPADRWAGNVEAPASLADACRAAVEAEVDNVAMYDRLLGKAVLPEARQVLSRLQAASRDNHLPAFRRCVARLEGRGERARGLRRRQRGGRDR